ncbi:MAG: universal stress protein [Planctomycetaceae bacterium]
MNVLVAVDRSQATDRAVEFVGRMIAPHGDGAVTVTLFHVIESLPEELLTHAERSEHAEAYRRVCTDWDNNRSSDGRDLLERHKATLQAAGVAEADVVCKLVERESRPGAGKVIASLAIIEEMRAGDYQIVCLGRRGDSGAAGSFLGSVAEKVLREAHGRTIWVVD